MTRRNPGHSTDATRTRHASRDAHDRPRRLLVPAQVIASPETQLEYKIERLLGEGGFGQVYLARRLGRSTSVPDTVCIKASTRIDGWLREAYFGQLLDGHPRAIRAFDMFPLLHGGGGVLYCLALEYARHGDLSAFLHREGKGWPERVARREIAGILDVLGKLHRGQMLHRDLTPMNVFVCDGKQLKLGDFGIVRQQNDRRGITAHTLNRSMVPSDFLASAAPKWQARDDVFQVGQCSDHLKEIVYRCIGERRKRYESADELIEAIRNPPKTLKVGVLRTMKGVHSGPSSQTTVVVRGKPNAQQAAGQDAGLKLMEIKRLREKGHRITLLNETQFWRLVGKR